MDALTWEETAVLGEALSHPSPAVRLAALRALVRLPLEVAIWQELSAYVDDLLGQQPEGELFQNQTLKGIPFKDVLETAVFIPTRSIRERLYEFLSADDAHVRGTTARALTAARDPAAVKQFVWEIEDSRQSNPEELAELLSLLDVSGFVGEVRAAYDRAVEPDTRFWFALALAKAGQTQPLEQVLADLAAGIIELESTWGDPVLFSDKLFARGPFPENIRMVLESYSSLEDTSTLVNQIAADLSRAGQLAEESTAEEPEIDHLLEDPALQALSEQVTSQFLDAGELDEDILQKALQPELLRYLPADIAARLVTALFGQALLNPASGFFGNEIVLAIYETKSAFTPDIKDLYQLYRTALDREGDDEANLPPWGFRWQIAWTVSRAPLSWVIRELRDPLRSGNEPQIVPAAQLIEEVARYAAQEFPPIFGGGSSPVEVIPSSALIDDSGHGGDAHAANGGNGGADEGIETGSIPDYVLEDLATEDPEEGSDEPRTRGFGFVDPQEEGEKAFDDPSDTVDPRYSYDLEEFEYADDGEEAGGPSGGEGVLERTDWSPFSGKARERKVNTGFSFAEHPDEDLWGNLPLKAGGEYFFWLSIGPRDIASLETGPTPEVHVPLDAKITVALFGFKDGLILTPGADVGELRERGGLAMEPTRQPLGEQAPATSKIEERLYFPINAPLIPGKYQMRCNLYWGQILLQSRLVEAEVEYEPIQLGEREAAAINVTADYTIAPSLNPSHLRQLPEHRLSVLMNQNGDGTHSFHFLGAENGRVFKNDDIRFGENELQDMITTARKKLRRVSWGTEEEWDEEVDDYLYQDRQVRIDRLKADLFNMAQWGYAFYDALIQKIAGREMDEYDLQDLMKKPGIVQIALKESPSYILPISLIYDHELDVGAPELSLCQTFEGALASGQALETLACFQGNCPSSADRTVICPSGFWGFRHYLGTPLTVVDSLETEEQNGVGRDVPPTIEVEGDLRVAVGVATNLVFTETHIDTLRHLRAGTNLDYADNRKRVFEVLRGTPHVVYFYCHGGYAGSAPYLQVGGDSSQTIDPSNIRTYRIRWASPRPLVFINGCHTTSVSPLQALDFIKPFVTRARCAGVIGTEITIFEELATTFAEACLSRFYAGEGIGMAIRNARLTLLQEGNPLGLVYIPFVMAGLHLVAKR
jgi:hypothetical protein